MPIDVSVATTFEDMGNGAIAFILFLLQYAFIVKESKYSFWQIGVNPLLRLQRTNYSGFPQVSAVVHCL